MTERGGKKQHFYKHFTIQLTLPLCLEVQNNHHTQHRQTSNDNDTTQQPTNEKEARNKNTSKKKEGEKKNGGGSIYVSLLLLRCSCFFFSVIATSPLHTYIRGGEVTKNAQNRIGIPNYGCNMFFAARCSHRRTRHERYMSCNTNIVSQTKRLKNGYDVQ